MPEHVDASPLPYAKAATLGRWAAAVVVAMACVELLNSARIFAAARQPRQFPYDYVSRGVWSAGAYVRPPNTRSWDMTGPIDAGLHLVRGESNLYDKYSIDSINYAYAPSAAVFMVPFGWIAEKAGRDRAVMVADVTWRLCALACMVLSAGIVGGGRGGKRAWLAAMLMLAAFYPLRWMLMCVQVQALITLALVAGVVAYGRSRDALAGVLIGLACCLKPHYGLLVLFGLIRKRYRFAAALCGSAAVVVAISLAMVGPQAWETFLRDVAPGHAQGYGFHPNQTLNGLVHRWLGHRTDCVVAEATPAVRVAGVVSLVVFGGLAIWPRRGSTTAGAPADRFLVRATDIGIALLGATLANPIAWEHYYAWTIVLFCALAAIALRLPRPGPFVAVLAAGYLLLGTYFKPFEQFASGPASLVNSAGLAGAVLLLAAAWYGQIRLGRLGAR